MTPDHYFSLRILLIHHFDRLFQPLTFKLTDRFRSSQVTSTQSTERYVLFGIFATDLHVKLANSRVYQWLIFWRRIYRGTSKRTYWEKQYWHFI